MSGPIRNPSPGLLHRDLLAGFVRLHVLRRASAHEIYGQWIIEELARHGYRLSAGTLYPMLHGMEERGYLTSREVRAGRSTRRVYRATALGEDALAEAKRKLIGLFGEFLAESGPHAPHAGRPPARAGSSGGADSSAGGRKPG